LAGINQSLFGVWPDWWNFFVFGWRLLWTPNIQIQAEEHGASTSSTVTGFCEHENQIKKIVSLWPDLIGWALKIKETKRNGHVGEQATRPSFVASASFFAKFSSRVVAGIQGFIARLGLRGNERHSLAMGFTGARRYATAGW
jgi:hypothetical protein